jgi:AraC-like DNA-binding protein
VGYKSLPQFSRDFKAHFDVTPSSLVSNAIVTSLSVVQRQ